MDTAILVEELNNSSFELVKFLNASGFRFTSAALMKNEDTEDWYLVIGIPDLKNKGFREAFETIYNMIKDNEINISTNDIKLVDDQSHNIVLLKQGVKTNDEISKVYFAGQYINGEKFPDSIVYLS